MKYYEDLINAGQGQSLIEFVLAAINEYKGSELYQNALTAYEYFRKRNVTITKYQKLLYYAFLVLLLFLMPLLYFDSFFLEI